jgi:hypothetical protein
MRTTVTFEDDVAAAIDRERRSHGGGLSDAVNRLIRQGLRRRPAGKSFVQRSEKLGIRIDVTNVAEAIEQLEGPAHR